MIKIKGKSTKKIILSLIIILFLLFLIFIFFQKKQKIVNPPPYVGKIEKKKKTKTKKKKPPTHYTKIAIIIDDVGYPISTFKHYLNFKGKLTFSVLPYLAKSKEYAQKLHKSGFELMIHIPMEPINYPKTNPGPNALLVNDSKLIIQKKVKNMIKENPWAVGANNHMGSRLTQDCQKMHILLKILNENHLFFIDSITTPKSCAYREAIKLNIPFLKRNIFLDNKNDYTYIKAQFLKLIDIAKSRGYAIGIGHIQNIQTLNLLKSMQNKADTYKFRFVFASEIISSK